MKTKIKNIKYLVIWIIIWLSLLSIATYAYTTQAGKIGSLFVKITSTSWDDTAWEYRLDWKNIKDNTVDNWELKNTTTYQLWKLWIGVYPSNNIDLAIWDNDTWLKQQWDWKLAIYTNNSERVRIDNNWNVWIWTSSPSKKLDVNWNIKWKDSILSTDQWWSIELWSSWTPYIDFKNNASDDYDGRIILTWDNELAIDWANLKVSNVKTTCIWNCY